jgi:hypothetical protein
LEDCGYCKHALATLPSCVISFLLVVAQCSMEDATTLSLSLCLSLCDALSGKRKQIDAITCEAQLHSIIDAKIMPLFNLTPKMARHRSRVNGGQWSWLYIEMWSTPLDIWRTQFSSTWRTSLLNKLYSTPGFSLPCIMYFWNQIYSKKFWPSISEQVGARGSSVTSSCCTLFSQLAIGVFYYSVSLKKIEEGVWLAWFSKENLISTRRKTLTFIMTLRRSAAAQVLNGVVHTAWQNAGPIDKGETY